VISGTGFKTNQFLTISVAGGAGTSFYWVQANSVGAFSHSTNVFNTGKYAVKIYDSINSSQLTSCSFSVV